MAAILESAALGSLASGALLAFFILIGFIVLAGVAFGAMYAYKQWKKYRQVECLIFKKNGLGGTDMTTDIAGVFVDKKSNSKRLFLKRMRLGLQADEIPIISAGKRKIVFILQKGTKNFLFINPKLIGKSENLEFQVGEEDLNWALNAFEAAKKSFLNSQWMQYIPMLVFSVVIIAIVVVLIVLFKNFDVIAEASAALKEASRNMAIARSMVP